MIRGWGSRFSVERAGPLGAALCAVLGLFLLISDLGERQHWTRLAVELALFIPLIYSSLKRHIGSRS
jgi:hypothetical protein